MQTVVHARERLLTGLPVTERRLQCAGVETAVLEGGEGPPLVLLHGAGEFAARWVRVIPDLAATHRVVAPDLPGHGATGTGDGPLDADRVLAWLDALVEQTCASPPTLVGHLLGGAVAARFAATRPDRLDRLVLVDAYGLSRFRPTPGFALALAGFVARPGEGTRERLFRQCAAEPDRVRRELGPAMEAIEEYVLETARTPGQRAALRSLMPAFGMRAVPAADLARITAPTTLIWGRHDPQARLRSAEAASARHGWPLHVVDGAGDDPALERPEPFLQALRTALTGARPHTTPSARRGRADTAMTEQAPERERAREAWDQIAADFDRFVTPSAMSLGEEVLRLAGLRPGVRFLDVAAGSGALSIPAARLGADVVATDLSAAMLERLRARAHEEGLARVEVRAMDGAELELEDDAFDVTGSQNGVSVLTDPRPALAELVRVTRPGGRVVVAAFGAPPPRAEFLGFFLAAVRAAVPGFAGLPTDPPPPFQLADPARMHRLMAGARLADVRVETVDWHMEVRSAEHLWHMVAASNPIAAALTAGLAEEHGAAVRRVLDGMLRERSGGGGGAVLVTPMNIGIGTA